MCKTFELTKCTQEFSKQVALLLAYLLLENGETRILILEAMLDAGTISFRVMGIHGVIFDKDTKGTFLDKVLDILLDTTTGYRFASHVLQPIVHLVNDVVHGVVMVLIGQKLVQELDPGEKVLRFFLVRTFRLRVFRLRIFHIV